MKYIYDIHKIMTDRNLILIYEGEFTQEITKSVLAMTEKNLDVMGEESNIKRKVFNVMVECLQNICKHSDNVKEKEKQAIFMIGKENDYYLITSGNYIRNPEVEGLRTKLEKINSLDKEGLKALYKDLISNNDGLSDKGGAGLGFVDIARKSGEKLGFEFEKVNEEYSFFSFKTQIGRYKDSE